MRLPSMAGRNQRAFCSGVPKRAIGGVTYSHCTLTAMLTPPEPHLAISSASTSMVR